MALHIGCIGCGSMGGALMGGLARQGGYHLSGYNRTPERMRPLEELGVRRLHSPSAVAEVADVLLIGVKPRQVLPLLREVRSALRRETLLVSVAAGVSRRRIVQAVDARCPVVRCMPNTPALVGMGVFALCLEDDLLSEEDREVLRQIFARLGTCVELAENEFPAFSALMGAGPAYAFSMMQGLVQAGVTLGFAHREARRMVAALFAGSAMMAEQSGEALQQLRDNVCSPGGLTIAGVNMLDRAGLTGILVDAVAAAHARAREMED